MINQRLKHNSSIKERVRFWYWSSNLCFSLRSEISRLIKRPNMSAKLFCIFGAAALLVCYVDAALKISAEKPADKDAQATLDNVIKVQPQITGWMGRKLSSSKRTVTKYATANGANGSKIYLLKTRVDPPKGYAPPSPIYVIYRITKSSKGQYIGDGINDGSQGGKVTATSPINWPFPEDQS